MLQRLLERLEAREGDGAVEILYQTPHQEAVFAGQPRGERVWSEPMPVSPEDMEDENVYAATDRCSLYRLRRAEQHAASITGPG